MHSHAPLFTYVPRDVLLLCVCVGLSTLLPFTFLDSQETAAFLVHLALQDMISAAPPLDGGTV